MGLSSFSGLKICEFRALGKKSWLDLFFNIQAYKGIMRKINQEKSMRLLIAFLFSVSLAQASDIYKLTDKKITGEEFKLSELKGKVTLVVNIASQCGYTSQMAKLESLYQKFKDRNFLVLGVPTNDFGGQTPEDDKAMLEFCQKNYNASFPILTKKTIQGKNMRALYKFLTQESPKKFQGEVGWNFEKFLVNRKGEVVGRMRSSLDPMDKEMLQKIESQL